MIRIQSHNENNSVDHIAQMSNILQILNITQSETKEMITVSWN